MNFVKFIDKEKAEQLRSLGYRYAEEQYGDVIAYSFIETPELMDLLNSKFSAQDFFISDIANF